MYIYVDIDNFFLNFILHYLPIKINFILRKLFHSAQVKESSKRERERNITHSQLHAHTHTPVHTNCTVYFFCTNQWKLLDQAAPHVLPQ